jgi:hypothetical protein
MIGWRAGRGLFLRLTIARNAMVDDVAVHTLVRMRLKTSTTIFLRGRDRTLE